MKHLAVALIGWLGFVTMSSADAPTDPGHIFNPVGAIFPSYSSWAITVTTKSISDGCPQQRMI